ncbi:MAG: TIGR02757 family protein [Nitrospiraceae bacterium]|nr:TIGR02757 family protein [Nitrospiraceae bacterium]
MKRSAAELKKALDRLYADYDFKARVRHDPIEFPSSYKHSRDIEASGFIASCLAYGRVDLFKPVTASILSAMGCRPYEFLINFERRRDAKLFSGISYRFNSESDILSLVSTLSKAYRKYGSIEALFLKYFSQEDANTGKGLEGMAAELIAGAGSNASSGFMQFFPLPSKGSACKRMNLFLRWMIRDRDIDFGIWKKIPKNRLIIPLDTHIARIALCIELTKRRTADWKAAVEITDALKNMDSEDPLKYDFALCHQGISRVCEKSGCSECRLFSA